MALNKRDKHKSIFRRQILSPLIKDLERVQEAVQLHHSEARILTFQVGVLFPHPVAMNMDSVNWRLSGWQVNLGTAMVSAMESVFQMMSSN